VALLRIVCYLTVCVGLMTIDQTRGAARDGGEPEERRRKGEHEQLEVERAAQDKWMTSTIYCGTIARDAMSSEALDCLVDLHALRPRAIFSLLNRAHQPGRAARC
jgi:hypothetical protein